jgi:hypothetical protein
MRNMKRSMKIMLELPNAEGGFFSAWAKMSCANSMTGVREIKNLITMVRMNVPFWAIRLDPP